MRAKYVKNCRKPEVANSGFPLAPQKVSNNNPFMHQFGTLTSEFMTSCLQLVFSSYIFQINFTRRFKFKELSYQIRINTLPTTDEQQIQKIAEN